MTHQSELNHKFEVEIEGIPAPLINKIVGEAFSLYYQKYGDEMTEMENNEFMEICTSFLTGIGQVDYGITDLKL